MTNNINYAALSMNEIIFMDRNQTYGAFDIRKAYPNHIKRAIIGMVTFVTALCSYQQLSAFIHPVRHLIEDIGTTVTVTDIKNEMPTPPKPPKVEPPKGTPNVATAAQLEYRASSHDTDTAERAELIDPNIELGDHNKPGDIGPKGDPKGEDKPKEIVYEVAKPIPTVDFAEVMPEYPGGEDALLRLIRKSTVYPEIDKEFGRQGTVVVSFIIDENGKVTDRQVVKSASPTMDAESMRVVGLLRDFKPGQQSGRPIKVRYKMPFRYRLESE